MYIADLHIHSRYSRATSKDCTPEYLDLWARRKGIHILGTGDFTHPAWRKELREKLVPAEQGLYRLHDRLRLEDGAASASFCPRFVISGEISSIYKKDGKVRKVHSLILLPGLEDAERLSEKLETIGNIHSDGRPILGLDCHDLLEITLELCPKAIYIPAHIWTPHFSLFGAFSGFDSIEGCYGDLTPYIHALETGLSSDPPMNWRVSALDSFQLVSNSDAHSPSKLGREANLLDIELSYMGLYYAIQEGKGLLGTIEFFPEEGKYHYDGHRKCCLCLSPSETRQYSGICPVCGKKLTIGVSNRVEQLADREEGFILPGAKTYESLVPLPEVIAASMGYAATGKKALRQYEEMLKTLGTEFAILRDIPLEDIKQSAGALISEGISRLRQGRVGRSPGYDGEYGGIQLIDPLEREQLNGQFSLFTDEQLSGMYQKKAREEMAASDLGDSVKMMPKASGLQGGNGVNKEQGKKAPQDINMLPGSGDVQRPELAVLNPRQQAAVRDTGHFIAVIAGPGTGKTKTLVSRILYLLKERKVKPSEITAITFTNQAAAEIKERLGDALGGKRGIRGMMLGTFHSVCYQLLKKEGKEFTLLDQLETLELAEEIKKEYHLKQSGIHLLRLISLVKTGGSVPEWEQLPEIIEYYQAQKKQLNALDFDDLLIETIKLLEKGEITKKQFRYLLIDEFQDINQVQYQLIQALNRGGEELFAIGDPDQSIYGFRGAAPACFLQLKEAYPSLRIVSLTEHYRATPQILSGALSVISRNPSFGLCERHLVSCKKDGVPIRLITCENAISEAIFAAKEINRQIGGIDMLDAQAWQGEGKRRSFADIAILYRTHRQVELLETCLKKEGIPYVIAGREEFLTESAVREAIAFFRYTADKSDEVSGRIAYKLRKRRIQKGANLAASVPFEEIITEEKDEARFWQEILKYREKISKAKPRRLLQEWMEEKGLRDVPELQKLLSTALCYKTMQEFLAALSFGGERDLKRCGGKAYTSDAVTLMTLHGAKGTEYPVVMIYGASEKAMPFECKGVETDWEEERRLFYVGMTRAMEELIIITSPEPSPFLEEISAGDLSREEIKNKKAEEGRQLSLFDIMK